jgi:hypothetical protein
VVTVSRDLTEDAWGAAAYLAKHVRLRGGARGGAVCGRAVVCVGQHEAAAEERRGRGGAADDHGPRPLLLFPAGSRSLASPRGGESLWWRGGSAAWDGRRQSFTAGRLEANRELQAEHHGEVERRRRQPSGEGGGAAWADGKGADGSLGAAVVVHGREMEIGKKTRCGRR